MKEPIELIKCRVEYEYDLKHLGFRSYFFLVVGTALIMWLLVLYSTDIYLNVLSFAIFFMYYNYRFEFLKEKLWDIRKDCEYDNHFGKFKKNFVGFIGKSDFDMYNSPRVKELQKELLFEKNRLKFRSNLISYSIIFFGIYMYFIFDLTMTEFLAGMLLFSMVSLEINDKDREGYECKRKKFMKDSYMDKFKNMRGLKKF